MCVLCVCCVCTMCALCVLCVLCVVYHVCFVCVYRVCVCCVCTMCALCVRAQSIVVCDHGLDWFSQTMRLITPLLIPLAIKFCFHPCLSSLPIPGQSCSQSRPTPFSIVGQSSLSTTVVVERTRQLIQQQQSRFYQRFGVHASLLHSLAQLHSHIQRFGPIQHTYTQQTHTQTQQQQQQVSQPNDENGWS